MVGSPVIPMDIRKKVEAIHEAYPEKSQTEIARELDISQASVSRILNNKNNHFSQLKDYPTIDSYEAMVHFIQDTILMTYQGDLHHTTARAINGLVSSLISVHRSRELFGQEQITLEKIMDSMDPELKQIFMESVKQWRVDNNGEH